MRDYSVKAGVNGEPEDKDKGRLLIPKPDIQAGPGLVDLDKALSEGFTEPGEAFNSD